MTGQRFGILTVVERAGSDSRKRAMWKCRCDCGNESVVHGSNLRRNHTTSCGCSISAKIGIRSTTHGHSVGGQVTATFRVWCEMIRRCTNRRCKSYPNYGGRGITVCAEWLNDFAAFLEHIGQKPTPQYQIDRIDNNKGYEPGNVRWATRIQQMRNKRTNRFITHDGETMTVAAWAERTGMKSCTLTMRLNRGWSVADSLTRPLRSW